MPTQIKYLDYDGLVYYHSKIKTALGNKVDKVSGKGLSTNDFTNTLKNKLDGIAAGAQVNIIEGVNVNGAAVTPTNKIVNLTVPTKLTDLTNDGNFVKDANYVHTDNNFTTSLRDKLNGIATGAEANVQSDWNVADTSSDAFIKNKPAVPTKTSELTNDSGFITNQVNNLVNYYDQADINGMFNALSIPSKTSDLTNDSGFLTSIPIASASTLGGVKIGNGINVAEDGTISAAISASLDWNDITNKPTDVSYWTNDAGYITSADIPTKTSDLTNDGSDGTSTYVTQNNLATQLANKQDVLTAGDHINITGSTIKAVDYVHSDNPVPASQVTPVVTNSMIAAGTITADKLASGATVKLTLSTSDIGEGAALAANTLYGVYQ